MRKALLHTIMIWNTPAVAYGMWCLNPNKCVCEDIWDVAMRDGLEGGRVFKSWDENDNTIRNHQPPTTNQP